MSAAGIVGGSLKAFAVDVDCLHKRVPLVAAADIDDSKELGALKELIETVSRPIVLKEVGDKDVEPAIGHGWTKGDAGVEGFIVPASRLCARIRTVGSLCEQIDAKIFQRSVLGSRVDVFSEHTLDGTVHAQLMLGPWGDCLCLPGFEDLAYGSDQPLQGAVNKMMLFGNESDRSVRLDAKPDSFLFWLVNGNAILAMHSEHKADSSSDLLKALKTALAQLYFWKGVLHGKEVKEKWAVPFMTVERFTVTLFAMVWSEKAKTPLYGKVKQWDVSVPGEAYSMLTAMYRLMDWLRAIFAGVKEHFVSFAKSMPVVMDEIVKRSISTSASQQDDTSSSSTNNSAARKASKKSHDEAVHFLLGRFGQVEEQFPRGMPVAELRACGLVPVVEAGPWHFVVGAPDQNLWIKVADAHCGYNEAANLRLLNDARIAGVPKLVETCVLPASGCMVLVMEHCGSCVRHVGTWGELARHARELVETLAAVHRLGRVHGDVKDSNICAAPGCRLKLTDWEGGVPVGEMPGFHTDGYRAPETMHTTRPVFCEKSDVFSAGVVIGKWVNKLRGSQPDFGTDKVWTRIVAQMTAPVLEERCSADGLLRTLHEMQEVERIDDSPTKDEGTEHE